MVYEPNEEKTSLSLKHKVLLVFVGITIIALMVYYFVAGRTVSYPEGNLSDSPGQTTFTRDETMFPLLYQFQDIPYIVGVPSKGIAKVEGGYAYAYNDMGIIAAEVSKARTMNAYSADMYSSIYSVQSQSSVKELHMEDGYINGYGASYGVYEVFLPEMNKTVYEFMYLLKVDKESIILAATTESKKSDDFVAARDYLCKMINTVAYYTDEETPTEVTEEEKMLSEDGTSSKSENMYDDSLMTRQAVLTATQDYNKMCLIFSYINVKESPEVCYVVDAGGSKYNSAFVSPGEYGFVIPNVSEGDDLTVFIKSKSLDGATLSQQEYSDYLDEKNGYKEGNLHVEDYEDEDTTSSESEAEEITKSSDEDLDQIQQMLNDSGVEGDVLTQLTKLTE